MTKETKRKTSEREELVRLSAIERAAVEVVSAFHSDASTPNENLKVLFRKIRELQRTLG